MRERFFLSLELVLDFSFGVDLLKGVDTDLDLRGKCKSGNDRLSFIRNFVWVVQFDAAQVDVFGGAKLDGGELGGWAVTGFGILDTGN